MRVLLLGPDSQLGHDLRAAHAATGAAFALTGLRRRDLDVTDLAAIPRVLGGIDFDILVNCTGYHTTDEVEDNAALGVAVNSHAVEAMARACRARGARFVHVSTDYVFGGDRARNRPLAEDDPPRPVNVYGATKAFGEKLARHAHDDTVILRVASLFGVAGASGKGGNFVETIIRLARAGKPLRVVEDQVMSPTATADVAAAMLRLLTGGAAPGIFHVVKGGATSWHGFAREILAMAGLEAELAACRSEDFAARARYSVLDNGLASRTFMAMPDWRDALARYLVAKGHVADPVRS